MHPCEERQSLKLERQSVKAAHNTSSPTRLIVLHLPTLNQLRLLLDLLKLDDGPFVRSKAFNFRFQICEEVALRSDQRGEEMLVVVEPSMLSRYGLHFPRVNHYSELDLE